MTETHWREIEAPAPGTVAAIAYWQALTADTYGDAQRIADMSSASR